MMKKYSWVVLTMGLFLLAACGSQTKETNPSSSSASSSQADVLKTKVFELPLTDGNKQRQTILYKGDKIQTLTLRNDLVLTDEIKQSLAESGAAETKKLVQESMAQEEDYQQLDQVAGLTYEIELTDDQEFFITFTLDVAQLDPVALTKSAFFSGSEIDDVTVLTAEQYIKRLENYGATEIKPED